jgi:error-prone DNA polymerase
VGWDNPPMPWRELERRLSWGTTPRPAADGGQRADGGQAAEPPPRPVARLPAAGEAGRDGPEWAELHCHSSYSFLDGASAPAELIAEAARRGLTALAITDHDGMYGVPQFAQAAARLKEQTGAGIGTVFGAELSLGPPAGGGAGPEGRIPGEARAGPVGRIPRETPAGPEGRIPGNPAPRPAGTCWSWPGTRRATAGCAG